MPFQVMFHRSQCGPPHLEANAKRIDLANIIKRRNNGWRDKKKLIIRYFCSNAIVMHIHSRTLYLLVQTHNISNEITACEHIYLILLCAEEQIINNVVKNRTGLVNLSESKDLNLKIHSYAHLIGSDFGTETHAKSI